MARLFAKAQDSCLLKIGAVLLALIWTLLAVAGLYWNHRKEERETVELAKVQARALAEKMVVYRHWNARHGGVYVEADAQTPPNPYLAELPERDVRTPSGRLLTMVNPAYMLREVFQLEADLLGLSGRITSTRPINPANTADTWEQAALLRLADGDTEVAAVLDGEAGDFLRYMLPLQTEAECLPCHAHQGYEIGNLRGGLSVSVAIDPLREVRRPQLWLALFGIGFFWLLGLGIILVGGRRLDLQARRRSRAEARVRFLDHHDYLTLLPNKSAFFAELEREIARSRLQEKGFSLLLVDVDGFKKINQALGHGRGDSLLRQVGDELSLSVGERGLVGHFGAGTFPVLLPNLSTMSAAGQLARELIEGFQVPFMVDGQEVFISCGCGITLYPTDGEEGAVLLQNAAGALQAAKIRGRGQIGYYAPEMNDRALERMRLESDLRRALDGDELLLYYQPQVDAESGQVIAAEALIRWRHPRFGLISPDHFVPMAEEGGLSLALGDWVAAAACRQLREWRQQGRAPLPVAINLSASQFHRPGLDDYMGRRVEEAGIAPADLILEVTEGALMGHTHQVLSAMAKLKERGFRIAIDDFGTGYSSLSYLKHFPIDALKIDQSFIRDLPEDGDSRGIVSAIIALGANLGLKVVAEGVEKREQFDYLLSRRCTIIQGYFYSPPLEAKEFVQWLDAREGR